MDDSVHPLGQPKKNCELTYLSCLTELIIKTAVIIDDNKSARAPLIQTPVRPNICGKINKAGIRIRTCLDMERSMAYFGLPVA